MGRKASKAFVPRVGIPRVCAYDGCKKAFIAYRKDKIYHTSRCRAYACIAREAIPAELLTTHAGPIKDFELCDPFGALLEARKVSVGVLHQRRCAFEPCDVMFMPSNAKHRFHSDACRYQAFVAKLNARKEAANPLEGMTAEQKLKTLEKLGIAVDSNTAKKLLGEHSVHIPSTPVQLHEMLTDASEANEQDDSWFDALQIKPDEGGED